MGFVDGDLKKGDFLVALFYCVPIARGWIK